MDRVPELYIGFLGVLKMGGIVQPLFSAFGDESLLHAARQRGDHRDRHPDASTSPRCARSATRCRRCEHIIVVDAERRRRCRSARSRFDAGAARRAVETFDVLPVDGRDPVGAALHLRHHRPAQGRAARPLLADLAVPDHASGCSTCRPDDIYWCNADPGWVTGTSYGIIGPWANGVTQVVLDSGFNAERWYAFIAEAPGHRLVLGARPRSAC